MMKNRIPAVINAIMPASANVHSKPTVSARIPPIIGAPSVAGAMSVLTSPM